ncbi:MAG: hypothetical protein N2485_03520 [bacterium]|nr:hypothetical protein [bacterium]
MNNIILNQNEINLQELNLYLSNWLYNSGILGLYRILNFSNINPNCTEHYLNINIKDLQIIPIAFFEYYIKKYIIEKIPNEITSEIFKKQKTKNIDLKEIKSSITNFLENEIKFNPNIEEYLVNIENTITNIENLLKIQFKNEIESILQKLKIKELLSQKIEKINTLNLLSYFQGLYFNKSLLAIPSTQKLPIKDKIQKFYQEYIKPIETEILNNIAQNKYETNKYYTCVICNKKYKNREFLCEFIESDFSILGVSSKEFINYFYFYKDNNKHYNLKCKICELILLCSFAGFTKKEDKDTSKTNYIFLSAPLLTDIIKLNQDLQNKTFIKILENLTQNTEILNKLNYYINNVYIVEINPGRKLEKNHKFTFFYINPILIELYQENQNLIKSLIESLNITINYKNERINLANETIKNLTYQNNIIPLIIHLLKQFLQKEFYYLLSIKNLIYLNFLVSNKIIEKNKKSERGDNLMDINKIYGIIKSIEREAANSFTISEINQNKRTSIAFRFLNLVKGNKKEDFYNELLRLYVVYNKPIPEAIKNILYESNYLTFQEKALAFITGFINPTDNSYIKNYPENISQENISPENISLENIPENN